MDTRRTGQRLADHRVSRRVERIRPPGALVGRPEDRHDRSLRSHGQVEYPALVADEQPHLLQQRHQCPEAPGPAPPPRPPPPPPPPPRPGAPPPPPAPGPPPPP